MNINIAKYLPIVMDLSNSRGDQLLVFECEGIPQSKLPMLLEVIRLRNSDNVLLVFEYEVIPQSKLSMPLEVIRLRNSDSVQGLPYQLSWETWWDTSKLLQLFIGIRLLNIQKIVSAEKWLPRKEDSEVLSGVNLRKLLIIKD